MYRVLYVDDDPNLLEVAKFFLGDSGGFTIATSTLATEALKLPDFDHFDAIISDYEMPRMDGITFLKNVRETHGDIPFILFTGKGREEVVIQAINNGADFYLQKGGDPTSQFAELAHKIKQAVERRKVEKALHESERRYRNLYQFALVGLFETSLADAKIVACNQQYVDMSGFSSIEEAIGSDVLQLYVNHEDRSEVSRLLHEKGSIENHEVRFRNLKTGVQFWAQFSARINREKDVAEGTIIDITARKLLEENLEKEHHELLASYEQLSVARQDLRMQVDHLAESERTLRINEERLVMAQEVGHTGSWEYDVATDTIWGSAEGLKIFGYPPKAGDFPVADIEACIPERERVHQALVDLLIQGEEYDLEYRINPADGSPPRVIHSIARVEKDAAGNPVRAIGVIHDITERKRAVEEVTFKNVILSTQQETSPDAILIVDENGTILNFNKKFIEIWGIPEILLVSHEDEPVLQFVVQQLADPEAFLSRVRYLYDHKDEKSFEELVLKDGRILERFSAPMIGEAGKYFGRVWYFRDITGRKKGEENLRESEARFHSLYSNMIEGAALHELRFNEAGSPEDYVILETNPAFERHLGIARTNVIGKTSRVAYGVSDPPYLEIYSRVAMTGRPEVFESYFPPLKKHFSISVYCPVPGRFATIFEDITERKGAEEALRNREGELHTLVQTIPDLIWLKDTKGVYLACNPMFERFFGAKEADILGKTDYDFVSRELANFFRENDRNAMAAGKPTRNEEWITFADDGHRAMLETTKTPMFDDKGVLLGVLGIGRDITERKRAEDELRASEQKFSTVFLNNPVSLTLVSAVSGAFVAVNDAFLKNTGYTQEDVIGRTSGELGIFVDPEESSRMVALLQDQHSLVGFELRTRKKNGDIRTCLFSSSIIQMGGTPHILSTVEDITEQKRAEDALRESEQRFRQLFDSLPLGMWIADRNGKLLMGNPAGQKIWEAHPQVGQEEYGVFKAWHMPLRDPVLPDEWALGYAVNKGRVTEQELLEIEAFDGSHKYILNWAAPLKNEAGTITGAFVLNQDITDMIMAEKALRESEEKCRSVIENIQDVYYRSDRDGRLIMMSPSALPLFGYASMEEIIGKPITETFYFRSEDRKQFLAQMEKTGAVRDYETLLRRRDGTPVQVSTTSHYYHDANGGIAGVEGILRDITEQRRAEMELRESEEKYRLLVENSHDAVYIFRGDRFLFVNRKASELSGFSHDELMQKNIWDLVHPDDRSQLQEYALRRFTEKDAPTTYSARILNREGEIHWMEFVVNRIMLKGELAALGMARDITRRKRAEEALRESEETFRSLVEESADGILLIDEDGTVIEWNAALGTILGIPRKEAIGKPYFDLMERTIIPEHRDPGRVARIRNELETALKTGNSAFFSRRLEAEICRPDGTRRIVQQTVFPVTTGKGFRIGSITRDITDLK
jgi:PAS domain S-box-containing protein